MRIWLAATAVLFATLSAPALADRDPLSGAPLPPQPLETPSPITDHFYASAALYSASVRTSLRVDPSNAARGVSGTPLSAERDLGLPARLTQGRVEFMFRLGERSKVRMDYFEASRTADHVLANAVVFGDQTFAPGSRTHASLDWKLFGLTYTYSFYRTDRLEIGSGIGVYFLQAEAHGSVPAQNQSQDESAADPFPTLPLDLSWRISRRLAFTGRVNYLKTSLSQFHGWLADSHADLQFRCNPNLSLGLGYTSMRTSYNRNQGSFTGSLYLSYNGPEALLRLSF
ncbi:MAG: hypothetical protein PVSMB6_00130 [Steroidobacteraceae bacterium]